jgi:hypothetical protein
VLGVALRTSRLGMTTPRAVGVRTPYPAVPARLRDWVDATLDSPVVEHHDQVGGMSPGCATRVICADGTRAFVKAVGSELNPDTPTLFRREILALGLLGSHPLWADLVASYDEDGWVGLILEDVEGTHPDFADDAVMDRLLATTDELVEVMNARIPDLPRPVPQDDSTVPLYRAGPTDLRRVYAAWLNGLDQAHVVPGDLMPAWVVERRAELRAGVAALAEESVDHVVHWDIRNDNLLQRPTGELVFLDWGAFGIGTAWLDPLLARLERVHLPWFDTSLASSPALVAAGDDRVTSWLVGLGVQLAWRSHTATDVNLPALKEFRRAESARFLAAAARRLGFETAGSELPRNLGA